MNKKIKVLSISGWGRSGSTILGSVLGNVENFFYGGEIRNLWNRVLLENRICGEGVPIKESQLWGKIFDKAFGGFDKVDPKEMRALMMEYTRNRHLALMMLPGSRRLFKEKLKPYIENLSKLFDSIQDVTSASVIVDSSKSAAYSYVLSLLDNVDLYTIHLVRDPRGVNYSHKKLKKHTDATEEKDAIYMKQFGSVQGSLVWDVRNIASEMLLKADKKKFMTMKYEDFVASPRYCVNEIIKLLGEEGAKTPFVGNNEVALGENYAVWGNPTRFKTGNVKLKLDEDWKTKLSGTDKLISTLLTWPLLIKYKYY